MYKEILKNKSLFTNDVLYCLEKVDTCEKSKEICRTVFGEEISDESYIIFIPSDNGIIPLGYIELNDEKMTTSKYFGTFKTKSIKENNIDPTNDVIKVANIHINSWVFDDVLREELSLHTIFGQLLYTKKGLVWCDSTNKEEIIYYNLTKSNHLKAAEYFATKFKSE